MGVTAANVPKFTGQNSLSLADLDALAEVVKANMQETAAPPAHVRVGRAMAAPAHDLPASGVYYSGVKYEPVGSHVTRPGLVQDLAWASGIDRPVFVRGHGLLPLAESMGTFIDGGTAVDRVVPGGIAGVRISEDATLAVPRILPGGIIELPQGGGGGAPLAQWGTNVGKTVPGLIQNLTFETVYEAPECSGGQIYFPLAQTKSTSVGGSPVEYVVPGAIAGVQYATAVSGSGIDGSGIDKPRILKGGIIELPRPGDAALKGVRSYFGEDVEWAEIEAMAGSQVGVASVMIETGGVRLPLSLAVGYTPAGTLSFALYNATL